MTAHKKDSFNNRFVLYFFALVFITTFIAGILSDNISMWNMCYFSLGVLLTWNRFY